MSDWKTCQHDWRLMYGPVMKCHHCGAHMLVSMDGRSQPIFPPAEIRDVIEAKP